MPSNDVKTPDPAAPPREEPALPVTADLASGWLRAYQELQQQVAQAHGTYQRLMAESHLAYLRTAESTALGLQALLTGQAPALPRVLPLAQAPAILPPEAAPSDHRIEERPTPSRLAPDPALQTAPVAAPTAPQPEVPHHDRPEAPLRVDAQVPSRILAPEPVAQALGPDAQAAPMPRIQAPSVAAPPPTDLALPRTAPPSGIAVPEGVDFRGLLLSVVAEKTGYPQEILQLDMGLESDLGIDSIKRVEILSALQERAPWLPEVDASEIPNLQTLGQVLEMMERVRSGGTGATKAAPSPAPVPTPQPLPMDEPAPSLASSVVDQPETAQGGAAPIPFQGAEGARARARTEAESLAPPSARDILAAPVRPIPEPARLPSSEKRASTPDEVRPPGPIAEAAPQFAPEEDSLTFAVAEAYASGSYVNGDEAAVEPTGGPPPASARSESRISDRSDLSTITQVTRQDRHISLLVDQEEIRPTAPETASPAPRADAGAPNAEVPANPEVIPLDQREHAEVVRLIVEAVPEPASGTHLLGRIGGGLLCVTDEGTGVGRVLVGKLRQRGLRVELVDQVPQTARGVIFMGGLRPVIDEEAAIAVNREAFRAAQQVAGSMANAGGLFVTVQATGGDFGLSGRGGVRAWLGGLAGLVRTAAKEWPRALLKTIDLERGSRSAGELAQALLEELVQGGPELEVGLQVEGQRVVLKDRLQSRVPGQTLLGPQSVVVVTGGARGVTAACVSTLARRCRCRFLILGRTALEEEPEVCRGATDDASIKRALLQQSLAAGRTMPPSELGRRAARILHNREIRRLLDEVHAAGTEALYHPADVRSREDLVAGLTLAREQLGPITALIHGAGVLSDKRIADKTGEQFDRVFDTKVEGLRLLLEATQKDPLEVICLFSSVAGRHGNPGQCDYAMANEVQNQVAAAEARRRKGACLVRSIGWGPWEGGMVTPTLAAHFHKLGIPLVPLGAGAEFLAEELASERTGPTQILAVGQPR